MNVKQQKLTNLETYMIPIFYYRHIHDHKNVKAQCNKILNQFHLC